MLPPGALDGLQKLKGTHNNRSKPFRRLYTTLRSESSLTFSLLGSAPFTAVYVGNYEYDASERELERTFEKYGDVDRVEYKSGAPPPTHSTRSTRAPPRLPPHRRRCS